MPQIYRFIVKPIQPNNPRAHHLLMDAHAIGLHSIVHLERCDIYFIQGEVNNDDLRRIAEELLSDPITQIVEWGRLTLPQHEGIIAPKTGEPSTSPVILQNQNKHLVEVQIVEVALRPGVTDPVAEQIVRASHELGIDGVDSASTGFRYLIHGTEMADADLHRLAHHLLANTTIHRFAVGEIEPVFPEEAVASAQVLILPVRELDDAGLLQLSQERRAALDINEMKAIQQYFQSEGRDPSDMELEAIAQTWSEHCVHKTFKAQITYPRTTSPDNPDSDNSVVIDSLLDSYLRNATDTIAAPWVRSAFIDNAGIIDFDDEFEVSFKVETHNHPSAIEPFGGANTGVGGVIRDILGVSAKPIANTDVLCFGPQEIESESLPEGVLHPRRIRSGVVSGVEDYGNKLGIPTVNGAILYDPGYVANPLVFCGCVGIAPKDAHSRDPQPGDRVIVIGGRTGRDGLRGATFSSMAMDAQTGEVSGASVQIGNPIVEKGVTEVVLRARDENLYHAITDCGAGGLSSAVGEMSSKLGADIELKDVRLKYAGLAPWEIWLSEAQERMVLAVPQASLGRLVEICSLFEVEWSDIGTFTSTGRLVVRYHGKTVLDMDNVFLHDGIPQRKMVAQPELVEPQPGKNGSAVKEPKDLASVLAQTRNDENFYNLEHKLLSLLSHPDIASKEDIVRVYDHEVQGGSVVKPLTGMHDDGPSDGCVIKPLGTKGNRGIALANGINPEYGKVDTYLMSWSVIDEAIRNAVSVGADPERIALLDNFCWGDPNRPETLHSLVEAARGCHDAAVHFRTPFISGKDSLNNEYLGSDGKKHAIPPTLLISSIGIVEDFRNAVTMDLKLSGSSLYLVGDFHPVWGGSHYAVLFGYPQPNIETDPLLKFQALPGVYRVPEKPAHAALLYKAIHQAMCMGLVLSCHDLSEGGLGVAAAEMCIAGRMGLSLNLPTLDAEGHSLTEGQSLTLERTLFGETNGCLLVEVRAEDKDAFESLLSGLPYLFLGKVTGAKPNGAKAKPSDTEPFLEISTKKTPEDAASSESGHSPGEEIIRQTGEIIIRLPVSRLVQSWKSW